MEQLVELFVNNGVAVAVVIYFLARDWKFNDELHKTLQTLIDTVDALKDLVDITVTPFNGVSPTNKLKEKEK